jgi:DNA-binding transcriptional regulator/RsmH inhibitor MraZ
MRKQMSLDAKKRLDLPSVQRASDNDSWLRLMVTNPLNGVMSTFSNEIVELKQPKEEKPEAGKFNPEVEGC